MKIVSDIYKIYTNVSDYWWSGIFKAVHFGFRLLLILILSGLVENSGYLLALYAFIEMAKVGFDFGMEIQIINGIAKVNRIKPLLSYRWCFSIAGQALVCALVIMTYSDKDLLLILACSLSFLVLMLQGFTTAVLQSYQAFGSYLKAFWYMYVMAGATAFLGWRISFPTLLIVPEIFLALASIAYVRRLSSKQNDVRSIGFLQFFALSKHYAINAVLSTFYTRIDTAIIFIYSMQNAATHYLYLQRIMSAPLFIISFLASVYVTKVAANKEYLHKGIYLLTGSMIALIIYFLVIINMHESNLIVYLVFFLTAIKISNAYMTAALVALGEIKIVSKISIVLAFMSIFFISAAGFFENVAYLPVVLILAESFVMTYSIRELQKNAGNHNI